MFDGEDPVMRILLHWKQDVQEEVDRGTRMLQERVNQVVNDFARGAISPAQFMEFMKSMGMDPSRLSGMVGQHQGFDPYRVLGLDKSASDEEVKHRYRELLHHLHPDTAGTEGTEALLQMVMASYEMIKGERGW
jgi:DnaJ-domain-containing protein 1